MKIQSNSRQIPDTDIYTADKKYCDLLYGVLQEMSYSETIGGVTTRYVIGFSIGKVMLKNCWIVVAPSTRAASYKSLEITMIPA